MIPNKRFPWSLVNKSAKTLQKMLVANNAKTLIQMNKQPAVQLETASEAQFINKKNTTRHTAKP
jgi:hypothetical protein